MAEKKNRVRRLENCDGGEITRDQLEQSLKQMIRVLGEPQREYKDRIFRMLLKDRKTALEVYNAMNDTHYTDENAYHKYSDKVGEYVDATLRTKFYDNGKSYKDVRLDY